MAFGLKASSCDPLSIAHHILPSLITVNIGVNVLRTLQRTASVKD